MRRGIAGLLGILALAAAVAGCGGGGEEALTKSAYLKRSDAICRSAIAKKDNQVKAAFTAAEKEKQPPSSSAEVALLLSAALPPVKDMTEELGALSPPKGDEEKAEAIVSAFDEGVAEVESKPKKVFAGSIEPFATAVKLAKAYGLKDCAQV